MTALTARFRLGIGTVPPTWHQRGTETLSVQQFNNARREADYVARRNGVKPALLQLFKVTP